MGGFAYLVDFAHKFEDWDLEMLGKMILRCVLLHRLIRNTAAEVDRGGGELMAFTAMETIFQHILATNGQEIWLL